MITKLAAFALAALIASGASANIIYDNGAPNFVDGLTFNYPGSGNYLAEDFVLAQDASLTDIHFWAFEDPRGVWDGTVSYFLHADGGGSPSAVAFASGFGQSITKTPLGVWGSSYNMYEYSLNLQAPINLTAGTTYWLGLQVPHSQTEIFSYWTTTGAGYGQVSQFHNESYAGGLHQAFYLTGDPITHGVPDGGQTSILLGLGVAVLSLIRRSVSVVCS